MFWHSEILLCKTPMYEFTFIQNGSFSEAPQGSPVHCKGLPIGGSIWNFRWLLNYSHSRLFYDPLIPWIPCLKKVKQRTQKCPVITVINYAQTRSLISGLLPVPIAIYSLFPSQTHHSTLSKLLRIRKYKMLTFTVIFKFRRKEHKSTLQHVVLSSSSWSSRSLPVFNIFHSGRWKP